MDIITIPVQVIPDFTITETIADGVYKSYGETGIKYSYLLDRQLCVLQKVDNNGNPVKYSSPKFMAIRIADGKIQIIHDDFGWIADEEATKKYIELQAEKELLGENNSSI